MPRTQARPKHRVTPKPTPAQRKWIKMRDAIGWELDMYFFSDPGADMRVVIRQLEDVLARGDRAVGLLPPSANNGGM